MRMQSPVLIYKAYFPVTVLSTFIYINDYTLGYRMFDVDYEDDGYVYDVRQQGWQVGLTWAF
jgi:hypothetical protein